jgi:hypothetical protein
MAVPLSNAIRALLDGPNFAHLATLMPDGSPHSVPVWVDREGDRILICTGEAHSKRRTHNAIRVSRSPSSISTIRIRRRSFEAAWSSADLMANSGTWTPSRPSTQAKPFPFRSPEGRVALVIEFEKARYTKLPFEHTPPK